MSVDGSNPDTPILEARDVTFRYGAITALRGVTVSVGIGEVVCVIGPNGAGKSTLAHVIGGLAKPGSGSVLLEGGPLPSRPHKAVVAGVASVLEGRRLFPNLSVRVNLELGAYGLKLRRSELEARIDQILEMFPGLKDRIDFQASLLSGGEQQMVAMGRALISQPRVLVLDEPTMGLSPKNSGVVFESLGRLRTQGMAILLIEQNASLALALSDRGYALRQGAVAQEGTSSALAGDGLVREIYLGGGTVA